MHRWGSPKYFYEDSAPWLPWLAGVTACLLLYGVIAGLFFSPIDYQQKEAFRIIYVHVPSAILSLFIYTLIGINSILFLVWRLKVADVVAKAAAPIGAVFTFLALLTGAIWGKPMWGTWWVWDARLTSELILLFLYMGYIGLRSSVRDEEVGAKGASILALVGLIDIPIIHYSVEWWNTLHQGATISKFAMPSISTSMLIPLIAMILGFALFFVTVCLIQARTLILVREQRTQWVKDMVNQTQEGIC